MEVDGEDNKTKDNDEENQSKPKDTTEEKKVAKKQLVSRFILHTNTDS